MAKWNLWHGCHKISPGCKNCYVYRFDAAFNRDASSVSKTADFGLPLRRKRNGDYKLSTGETIFTCFTSDFFLNEADYWRIDAWNMIRLRTDLQFYIITKRIDRFNINIPPDWGDGYENVTICSTCETQEMADYRLPILLDLPIKHKAIICEPLLGRINLLPWLAPSFESVIVGESLVIMLVLVIMTGSLTLGINVSKNKFHFISNKLAPDLSRMRNYTISKDRINIRRLQKRGLILTVNLSDLYHTLSRIGLLF